MLEVISTKFTSRCLLKMHSFTSLITIHSTMLRIDGVRGTLSCFHFWWNISSTVSLPKAQIYCRQTSFSSVWMLMRFLDRKCFLLNQWSVQSLIPPPPLPPLILKCILKNVVNHFVVCWAKVVWKHLILFELYHIF